MSLILLPELEFTEKIGTISNLKSVCVGTADTKKFYLHQAAWKNQNPLDNI